MNLKTIKNVCYTIARNLPRKIKKPVIVSLSLVFFIIAIFSITSMVYSQTGSTIALYILDTLKLFKIMIFDSVISIITTQLNINVWIAYILYFLLVVSIIYFTKLRANQTKVTIILVVLNIVVWMYV